MKNSVSKLEKAYSNSICRYIVRGIGILLLFLAYEYSNVIMKTGAHPNELFKLFGAEHLLIMMILSILLIGMMIVIYILYVNTGNLNQKLKRRLGMLRIDHLDSDDEKKPMTILWDGAYILTGFFMLELLMKYNF